MVAYASVVGRKVAIRPKRRDDWTVVPNLWGTIIGRPGTLKSPALQEALRPLSLLEKAAKAAQRGLDNARGSRGAATAKEQQNIAKQAAELAAQEG